MARKTKFLTKATAERTESLVDAIITLAGTLPEPKDYLAGRRRGALCLPDNIMCFHRQSSYRLVPPGGNSSPRQHHRCILLISLGGTGRVHIDDRSILLDANEAVLILPFQFHYYDQIAPEQRCWIFITFEQADLEELSNPDSILHSRLDADDLMLLRWFLQDYKEGGEDPLSLTLGLLLNRLTQKLYRKSISENPGDDLLRAVNAYILTHLDQPISVKQLAESLGLSASHLRSKFRALVNRSLGHHMRTLRVQRACSFLYSTNEAVSRIADRCGFPSVYSFSRTFKNEMGLSPRTYRESRRSSTTRP